MNPLAWQDDYSEFVEELKLHFGALDLIGESESKIENLTMKSSQRIAKYIVEFNRLATIMGWDGHALQHQFYPGLPSHIKDEWARIGKPATLPTLKALAQSIDGRYWEREEETRREPEISLRTGRTTSCKTKPPAHRIIIVTTTATTIRTKIKNPI